jgi:hypothetical protein
MDGGPAAAAAGSKSKGQFPNLAEDGALCVRFLTSFVEDGDMEKGNNKYMQQLQDIANRKSSVLNISIDDLRNVREALSTASASSEIFAVSSHSHVSLCFRCSSLQFQVDDSSFFSSILHNTQRYVSLFYTAADALMPAPDADFISEKVMTDGTEGEVDFNPDDVYQAHRRARMETAIREATGAAGGAASSEIINEMFPPELMRRYEIRITPSQNSKPTQLRQIKAKDVSQRSKHVPWLPWWSWISLLHCCCFFYSHV